MKVKGTWLKLVLTASLALNLAFAAPYIYNKFIVRDEEPVEDIKLEKTTLNLRKEQKESLDSIIKKFRLSLMRYKQEILEKRIDIIDELGDPEFDPETVTARTNELSKLEKELNLLFVETLIQINALLEPGQRLNFLYKLSKNWFFINRKKTFEKAKGGENHE
jgi:Spy/CpxP family protein refolding chaperone